MVALKQVSSPDQTYIRWEWTSTKWPLSRFHLYRRGSYRWFQIDCRPLLMHFSKGSPSVFRFFESVCPELYAEQHGKWLDRYALKMDLYEVAFKHVSIVLSGIHLKSPLTSRSVPLKLDSRDRSEGPFSTNKHPSDHSETAYAHTSGHVPWKIEGGPFEKARI